MTVSADMLAAFLKVADHASVSRAADDLGIGKSVASKRVSQLEAALGTTLFSRSTRRVALTPAGEAYAEYARRALAELAAGDDRLRALRSDLTGRIRVTASVSWGQRVLARALPDFVRLHPGVELELHLDDRLSDLAFERFDVALRWSATPAPDLVSVPVAAIAWTLAAAPAYLAAVRVPQAPAELAGLDCLCYWRESADDRWTLAAGSERCTVQVRGRYRVDNPEAVLEAAIAGLGVAMLPDYLCRDALEDGRLQRVLPPWVPVTRYGTQITAVGTPERMRLARIRALVDWCCQACG